MKDDFVFPRTGSGAPGMELRDWFAGQAVQAFVNRYGTDISAAAAACAAFTIADAMMHFREMTFEEIAAFADEQFDDEEEQTND